MVEADSRDLEEEKKQKAYEKSRQRCCKGHPIVYY